MPESSTASENAPQPLPRWSYPTRIFEPDYHAPELALQPLDRIELKQLAWEGPGGYAPRGCVTIIAGEHGSGKTHLAVDWAARISKGYPAFGKSAGRRAVEKAAHAAARASSGSDRSSAGSEFRLDGPWLNDGRPINLCPSEAVIAHAGDLTVEELRRRIDAAGGLPERIAALSLNWPDREQKFTFSMLHSRVLALACAIRGAGDVRLLVIDNLEALAGNVHETPSAALTGFLLSNLAELAARANIAIVVLAHLPRAGGQAAARKLDAYCNAAPVVYLSASDVERPHRKLLVTVKNTLGPAAPARAFEIIDGKVAIREELPDVSADEFIAPLSRRLEARHERESAARWLLAALADGPVASRDLFRQARECGIATKTLRRAAESLGLSPRKSSFDGPWQWQLGEPARKNGEPEASASVLHRGSGLQRRVTSTPETEARASGSTDITTPAPASQHGQPRGERLGTTRSAAAALQDSCGGEDRLAPVAVSAA